MNHFRLVLVLITLLLTAHSAASPEAEMQGSAAEEPSLHWEPIYEDGSRSIDVETTTLKRLGNNVTVTLVTTFTVPREDYPTWTKGMGAPVKYWYEKIVFRCGADKFSNDYQRFEDADGKELRTTIGSGVDGKLHFYDIAVNSDKDNREIQYEAVCAMRP